ncbi:uncharacterized protein LOC117118162 [Anneissia japonica]|uniref:uncharacterized protein LOC117118162 n=1 Tax=Anneissia japonica TaxID=1529436 RepID=UPI0014254B24|nr:uncharacterized protein LOC117118162 [Anneissia japonica]
MIIFLRDTGPFLCSSQGINITGVNIPCLYKQPSGETSNCKCDGKCLIYGDCCKDKYNSFNETQISEIQVSTATCVDISSEAYYIIQTCASSWTDDRTRDLCEHVDDVHDILQNLPVYDPDGNHFKNMFCAFCNNIQIDDMIAWQAMKPETHSSETESDIFNIQYSVPSSLAEYLQPRICIDMGIAYCDYINVNESGQRCPEYYEPIVYENNYQITLYKNSECALCNGIDFNGTINCSSLGLSENDFNKENEGPPFPGFSRPLTVLLGASASKILATETKKLCKSGEVFDPFRKVCIILYCSDGYQLLGNQCIASICSTWLLQFNTSTRGNKDTNANSTLTCLLQNFETANSTEFIVLTSYSHYSTNNQLELYFELRSNMNYQYLSKYLSYLFPPNIEKRQQNFTNCNVTSMSVDQFCEYFHK